MIYFVLIAAIVLAAVAVWFIARPLTRGTHPESREEYFQLLTVRDRVMAQLNELDLDERDRSMEADTAADERTRLEAELVEVLKKLDALAPQSSKKQDEHTRSRTLWRWVVVALALAVPSVATGLYLLNVTVPPTQLERVAATTASDGMPDPLQMVARLEARLQQNPGNVAGWLRLGRSYAVLGRLEDAKAAYEHAYPLLPKDYEADSPEALWFLGLAAYNQDDSKRALVFWGQLLASLPPDSDAAQQLQQVMEQARGKGTRK